MAVFALTNLHVAVDELNLSCFANQVDVMAESEELDVTTFCGGGYRQRVTGLSTFMVNASGFQDYVAPSPGSVLDGSVDMVSPGTSRTFTVAPEGDTVGNVAYFGTAKTSSLSELSGAVGEVASFTLSTTGVSKLVRGQMLHPVSAETATGNGTASAFTTPTATDTLYAAFHVHSVTGSGSIVMNVQTDDNSGMSTPVTRIASTSFTAIGAEIKSLAGALAGETHVRTIWTISGFTSVTFSVAVGVGPT